MYVLLMVFGLVMAGDDSFNLVEEYSNPDLPRTKSAEDFATNLDDQIRRTLEYLSRQLSSQNGQILIPRIIKKDSHLNADQKQAIQVTIEYLIKNKSIDQSRIEPLVNLLAIISNKIEDILQNKSRLDEEYNFLQHLKETLMLLLRDVQEGGVKKSPSYSIFAGDLTVSPTNKKILDTLNHRMSQIQAGQDLNKNKASIGEAAFQASRVITNSLNEIVRELRLMFGTGSLRTALGEMPFYKQSKEKLGWTYDMLNTPNKDKTEIPRNYGTKPFIYTLDDLRLALETYNPVQQKSWLKREVFGLGARLPKFQEIQVHRNKILGLITVIKLSVAKIMAWNEVKGYNKYFTEEYQKLVGHNQQRQDQYAKVPRGGALPVTQGVNVAFDRNKNEIWILSLDGGGIRGIIGATILNELSKQTGKHPAEMFDLFAGTSTGGIMAIGLTVPQDPNGHTPRNDTTTLLSLYTSQGARIFPPYAKNATFMKYINQLRGFAYKADSLEGIFKQYFGEYKLSHAVKPVLVTSVSFSEGKSVTFSSRDGLDPRRDLPAWLAARATSAAPSYFPPVSFRYDGKQGVFVDGGITNNDPVYEALIEARKIYPNAKKINILSIGTGEESYKYNPDTVATGLGGLGMSFLVSMRDGEIRARKNMKRYARELETQGVHVNYIRLNPQLSESIELDKVDRENVEKLRALGRQVVTQTTFVPEVANRPKSTIDVSTMRRDFPIWSFPELSYTLCKYTGCAKLAELQGKITFPGFNATDPQSMGKPAQTSASSRGIPQSKPLVFPGDHGIRVRALNERGESVS